VTPADRGGAPEREEKGSAAESRRHPPHQDEGGKEGSVEESQPGQDEVPTTPATGHGEDKVPVDEEQERPIREDSMYGQRPGEDKDRKRTDNP
jgi:hypothetical protein